MIPTPGLPARRSIVDLLSPYLNVLLIVALVLTVATGLWVSSYNDDLRTSIAQRKILSLELAWTKDRADAVVNSWKEKGVYEDACTSIWIDFYFIAAYGFGLFVIALKASGFVTASSGDYPIPRWHNRAANILPFVAIGGDVVENAFMLRFLAGDDIPVILFSLPAAAKFIAAGYVVGYSLYATRIFQNTLRAARLFAPGLIAVIVSYALFTGLPQGQDVVIQIAESTGPKLWTIVTLLLWVWFTWYSSRLVSYTRKQEFGNTLPDPYHIHPPRLLAFNAIASIQTAIVALPSLHIITDNKFIPAFFLLQNVVFFCWSYLVNNRKKKGWRIFNVACVAVISAVYMYLLVDARICITPEAADHAYLIYFAFALYVISLLLIWLLFIRSKKFNTEEWNRKPECNEEIKYEYLRIVKLRVLPVLPKRLNEEQFWFNIFNGAAIFALLLYFGSFTSVEFGGDLGNDLGPLAFALLAFGVLVGFANVISILSLNYKSNYFAVLFILAIIIGSFYDPYPVRVIEGKETRSRPTISEYFDLWLNEHEEKIKKSAAYHANDKTWKYPVYMVIADGGASRSGYWVASVLGELQDESIRHNQQYKNTPDSSKYSTLFSDHLLCLAGASGGSVGNATFYALLKDDEKKQDQVRDNYRTRSQSFLKNDFLTPVLTHWFGSDLVQHIIPLPFLDDRGSALETVVEQSANETLHLDFSKAYTDYIDTTGRLPMLFINATSVQQGKPAVVSSVEFDSTISARIDVIGKQKLTAPIRYSTAFILGARFPFVSPAGKLMDDYYVDGGYFDNTGAGMVQETLAHLLKTMEKNPDSLYRQIEFHVIYLRNSSLDPFEPSNIHPLTNDLASPILTVLGTYSSQTDVNNRRLENYLKEVNGNRESITEFNLYVKKKEEEYPMNWVISKYSLGRMNRRLDNTKILMDPILNF